MKTHTLLRCSIAFFMILVLLFSVSVPAFADNGTNNPDKSDENSESVKSNSIYSCNYNYKKEQISIDCTVPHDLFMKYSEYFIEVYKILPSETLEKVVFSSKPNPIARSEMSIKFQFSFNVESVTDLFSTYVLVFVSEKRVIEYIGDELYPSIPSEYSPNTENIGNRKGLYISDNVPFVRANPTTEVITIELEKLFNSYLGYLYTLDNESIFFDNTYIDYLDGKIRALSTNDSDIYFQILLNNEESALSGKNYIPRFTSEKIICELYAACDFLSDRYSSENYGKIKGVIIGKCLNDVNKNDISAQNIEDYSSDLTTFGVVVGTAVRKNISDADIVYSFSNVNSFDGRTLTLRFGYASSEIIDYMCRNFDKCYIDGFDFSIMIESDITPFQITNKSVLEGVDISSQFDSTYISAQNSNIIKNYLLNIRDKYLSSPKSFIYYWEVEPQLRGNALCLAYAYSYYKLIIQENLSAFVADFSGLNDTKAFFDVLNVFKYIDTDIGPEQTEYLLSYFGAEEWSEVIWNFENSKMFDRTYITAKEESVDISSVKGMFDYFNYSDETKVLPWSKGIGCDGLSIAHNSFGSRSLRAHFSSDNLPVGEYSYLICKDIYPESYKYTPYLVFNFNIENDKDIGEVPFEVKISIGEGSSIIECTSSVNTGQGAQIIFDASEFSEKHSGQYIQIAVRPLFEDSGGYSLYLSSMSGLSIAEDTEHLSNLIFEERLKIRNQSEDNDAENSNISQSTKLLIAFLVAAILAATLFGLLRQHDDNSINEKQRK